MTIIHPVWVVMSPVRLVKYNRKLRARSYIMTVPWTINIIWVTRIYVPCIMGEMVVMVVVKV